MYSGAGVCLGNGVVGCSSEKCGYSDLPQLTIFCLICTPGNNSAAPACEVLLLTVAARWTLRQSR